MDEHAPDEPAPAPTPRRPDAWSAQWDVVRWVRAQSPLVFYAVAFVGLCSFGAFAMVLIEPPSRIWFAFAMLVALMLFVLAIVWVNVHHHEKLVLGEWSQYRLLMARFGSRDRPVDLQAFDRLPSGPAPQPPAEQLPPGEELD